MDTRVTGTTGFIGSRLAKERPPLSRFGVYLQPQRPGSGRDPSGGSR